MNLRFPLAALFATFASSCSLLFSATSDDSAQTDGGPGTTDAGPTLEFGETWEGVGSMPSGRPHVLVVKGSFAQDSILSLESAGGIEVGATTVSQNGTIAATTVRVPIMLDLAPEDEPQTFTIRATSGEVDSPKALTVLGLNELVATGTISVDTLDPRYSMIELGNTTFEGEGPVHLLATGSIDINGAVSVSANAATPGPGGCPGGLPSSSASCGMGGGQRGGLTNGGGGGAGHEDSGAAGLKSNVNDLTFGQPGVATGTPMLVPLTDEGGNGGGGSGGADGGGGGGGGGVLQLQSEGPLTFSAGASLRANGGNGGQAGCAADQGGGGGGSGGAILVRSISGINAQGSDLLQVNGGPGGGDAICLGGQGAPGRLRVDAPAATLLSASANYGPMWALDSPSLVVVPIAEFNVWGGTGRTFGLSVNRGGIKTFSIAGGIVINQTAVSVTLDAGANELCLSAVSSASFSQAEAWNCISVAYIPR